MQRWMILIVVLVVGHHAQAQIVQLPSFHVFHYSGTVQVPVGGSTSLGGNRYATASSVHRGGLLNPVSSRAATVGANHAAVSATVIDHEAWDRQVLGQTPEQFSRDLQPRASTAATDSIREGKALVRYGRSLFAQGRSQAARDAYEMALPLLDDRLRHLAIAEMRRAGLR